jgi:hypothetical protein
MSLTNLSESTYQFPFAQSFSESFETLPPSPMTPAVPSGIHSYYFEHGRDGGGEEDGEGRPGLQFFDDDENPHVMRTRSVARVADGFHGAEKTRVRALRYPRLLILSDRVLRFYMGFYSDWSMRNGMPV